MRKSHPRTTSPNAAQILHDRARALARVPEPAPVAETLLEVLEFRLAQERYAIEIRYVREVYPLKHLTPLPSTPSFVLGIVNVRGRILPVLDVRKLFGLAEQGLTDLHRIILLDGNGNGNDLTFGLLADAAVGVRSVPADTLQPPLPTLAGMRRRYLKGVTADHLVVLDGARMLADPNIMADGSVEK